MTIALTQKLTKLLKRTQTVAHYAPRTGQEVTREELMALFAFELGSLHMGQFARKSA